MNQINRIIKDLIIIIYVMIMPIWLMELLKIDEFLLDIIAESEG